MVLEFSEVLENETLTLGWKLTVNFINFQKKKKMKHTKLKRLQLKIK